MAWEALDWRDRIAALRMRGPIRVAERQARGVTRAIAASPGETVEGWLIRNGQTPRLREMLRCEVVLRGPRDMSIQHLLDAALSAKILRANVQRFTIDVDPVDLM